MSFIKRFFALFLSGFLVGCSSPVLIVKPVNLSLANQKVSAQFRVAERGGYRVALLFVWSEKASDIDHQKAVWGGGLYNEGGVPIPVHLRVLKDGQLFFDEVLVTTGIDSGQAFEYEGKYKSTQVRDIKHFAFLPGDYTVEVSTVDKIDAFSGTEGYVEFSYYSPKI
ncbi:hypothetical protein K5D43_17305 [Pseudomonas cichorii]|nr:DUF5625 family protein [Pseudomonas cichorii]MBX8556229.1 hypothetical protein [Pseudomonas cichorii]